MRELNVEIEITREELRQKLAIQDGKTPTDLELLALIEPLIPEPLKGEKGDKGNIPAHEWDGTKLRFQNPDGTWGEWVDLKGEEGKGSKSFSVFGSPSRGQVKLYDLSDQLNGVLKTFSLPAFWRVINVYSSSFPVAFRPTVDYTINGSAFTITFTDQVTASSTLATGQTLLVEYAEA